MSGREAAAEALGPFLRDFAQKAIDAAPTAVALTATGLAATALPDLLAAIERGDIPGVGVLPESETLAEEAFWREQESGTTQRDRGGYYHRGFIGGYVAALASGVTLAADREPDGLRAAVEALANAEALREHLDALNDAGIDCRAVGMDARGEPFLIALSGPYAESEVVLYGDPWDNEVDYGTGPSCVECMAQRPHTMDSLRFPVALLAHPATDQEEADRG